MVNFMLLSLRQVLLAWARKAGFSLVHSCKTHKHLQNNTQLISIQHQHQTNIVNMFQDQKHVIHLKNFEP